MTATRLRVVAIAAAVTSGLVLAASGPAGQFVDPLDRPAQPSELAPRSLMQAVTQAGGRLVAVGQYGHVLLSDDGGQSWAQASVPVSSDLTAVYFADGEHGWAVGHDGVVLATADAGSTWTLQLDGRRAAELLRAHVQQLLESTPEAEGKRWMLDEAERFVEQGADKPFLDVWFKDAQNGFVVGAFNLIFRTHDGGQSWECWFDRTDNPKLFNLYAIRPAAGAVYIAGEGGLILRLDSAAGRFVAQPVAYAGSFFGVTGNDTYVLVFGLRGNAYRSGDAGQTWTPAETGLHASIVSASRTGQGRLLLGDLGGRIVASDDDGITFAQAPLQGAVPLAGIASTAGGKLALAGPTGVRVVEME